MPPRQPPKRKKKLREYEGPLEQDGTLPFAPKKIAAATKMCLRSQLVGDDATVRKRMGVIQQWVDTMGWLTWRASRLLNLYLLHRMELFESHPELGFPDFDKDSLWYTAWKYPDSRGNSKTPQDVTDLVAFLDNVWSRMPQLHAPAVTADDVSSADDIDMDEDASSSRGDSEAQAEDFVRYRGQMHQCAVFAAIKLKTNASNSLDANMKPRLATFVELHFHNEFGALYLKDAHIQSSSIAVDILRAEETEIWNTATRHPGPVGAAVYAYILAQRAIYRQFGADNYWANRLCYLQRIQRAMERENGQRLAAAATSGNNEPVRLLPSFTLLPETQLKQAFIHIDIEVLRCMFGKGITFDHVFKRNSSWYKSVDTDGTSVVFLRNFGNGKRGKRGIGAPPTRQTPRKRADRHHQHEIEEQEECGDGPHVLEDGMRVVGVDPGRKRLVTVSFSDENGHVRTRKLTRQQYHHFTGTKRFEEWMQARLDRNPAVADFQTNRLARFERADGQPHSSTSFIRYFEKLLLYCGYEDRLWAHYGARRIARHRFRLYRQRQSALMRVVHTVVPATEKDCTIVSFGDASFGATGRGERAVPTTAHRRLLEQHCVEVVDVDEYCTTKCCCRCGADLLTPNLPASHLRENAPDSDPVFQPHGIRVCPTPACRRIGRVSRDGNAAKNMLFLYLFGRRDPFNREWRRRQRQQLQNQGVALAAAAPESTNQQQQSLGPVLLAIEDGGPQIHR